MKLKQTTLLTMGLVVAAVFSGCKKEVAATPDPVISVRTAKPELRTFRDAAATQGVIEPVEKAVLAPLAPGKLEQLTVKEGDAVKKGQLLFRSDRRNLENRVILAEQALNMAKERVHTREVDVEVAKLASEKAQSDFNRSETLYTVNSVSAETYETRELANQKAKLAIDQANAALATAKAEVSFAEATLKIAKKHLADSDVFAPYDGIITAKLRNENEFCNAGTPVLKIEKPGSKRISAVLSGIHFPQVVRGKTMIAVSFAGKELCVAPVTVMADTIDPLSRTFEVKADLPETVKLPSGTLCNVTVIMGERKSPGVPEEAVLFRRNGTFVVFEKAGDRAKEVAIKTGVTQGGYTEVVSPADLAQKDVIITGQYFVNDGSLIRQTED